MGPPSCMLSVVDSKVVMRRMTVFANKTGGHLTLEARNRNINLNTV